MVKEIGEIVKPLVALSDHIPEQLLDSVRIVIKMRIQGAEMRRVRPFTIEQRKSAANSSIKDGLGLCRHAQITANARGDGKLIR